jgi:Protein of unknown function DUF262.
MKMSLQEQLSEQKRKVDFNTYDLSIKELINMVDEKIIDIAPDYQRHFRWERNRQSSFIESIFLGIPIPSLFMATNLDGTWELIDGVQRVSTIISFAATDVIRNSFGLKDKLILSDLEKLTAFNTKAFLDLPTSIQLSFKLSSLKVTTLSDKSDLNVRFDLFERLNKGGVILSDQEIRSCVYRGQFNEFIKSLAGNEDFNSVIKLTRSQKDDGTKEELVLRFFAFLYNYQNFDHSVVNFLNDYMKSATTKFNYEKSEQIFNSVFRTLNNALPNGIIKNRALTPLNLFEAVTVGAALALNNKAHINTSNIEEWIKSDELNYLTTGSTNSKPKVIGRIEYCKNRFEA